MSTALVSLETFYIVCACGAAESMTVESFMHVYAEINRLGWGLVPTQHSERMKGVCPACRVVMDRHGETEQ
jgi:hypothetical protein